MSKDNKTIIIDGNFIKKRIINDIHDWYIKMAIVHKQEQELTTFKFKNLLFLITLEAEINTNLILPTPLEKINNEIEKRCWEDPIRIIYEHGVINQIRIFNEALKAKIVNNWNKKIKFSRELEINKIINKNIKKIWQKDYIKWKKNWFKLFNKTIENNLIKNSLLNQQLQENDISHQGEIVKEAIEEIPFYEDLTLPSLLDAQSQLNRKEIRNQIDIEVAKEAIDFA